MDTGIREDKMRATYFAVLMILYTVAHIFATLNGIDEMTQLTKLTGLISFVVLLVYYVLMGLYYMGPKHTIVYISSLWRPYRIK